MEPDTEKLSKRQQKKLKRREFNELNKEKWREHQKMKKKASKERKREAMQKMIEEGVELPPKAKAPQLIQQEKKFHIAIDLSFEHLMTFTEITSVCKQLCRCYSANRKTPNPVNLYFNGLAGKTMERLKGLYEYQNWDVCMMQEDVFTNSLGKNIVYLTADSDNVLESFSEDDIYIIGGLVDKNRHKVNFPCNP